MGEGIIKCFVDPEEKSPTKDGIKAQTMYVYPWISFLRLIIPAYNWVTAKISLNSLDRIFRILNFPKPGLNRGTRS